MAQSLLSVQKNVQAALVFLGLALAGTAPAQTITSVSPTLLNVGESMTISGTNLATTSQVLLNGQVLKITSQSATKVEVKLPIAASSGYLRLALSGGGTVVGGQRIRVKRKSSSDLAVSRSFADLATPPNGYSTPTATDLDGDGLIDLLVGDADGNIRDFEQTAPGGSFPTTGVLLTAGSSRLQVNNFAKSAVTDLDGDGRLDLLVGTGTGQRIMRFEQNGTTPTSFGPGTVLTTDGSQAIATADFPKPAIADLDGNGLLDLLVGDDNGGVARYEQAAATGTTAAHFGLKARALMADGAPIYVGPTSRPTVADWDGDGLLDLLVGNRAGNVLHYEQSGANTSTFTSLGYMTTNGTNRIAAGTGGVNNNYAAPTVTDVDNDGLMDLLLGSNNGTVVRFEQEAAAARVPLPVVLTAFGGQCTQAGNQLAWTTAQEVNSARFVLEASTNGTVFAELSALAAAGNSTTPRSYDYLDASAASRAASLCYYRLRMEDLDGSLAYSQVVALARRSAEAAATAEAWPNPFAETLYAALPGVGKAQATTVTLLTPNGRLVYKTQLELSAAPLLLPGLPDLPVGVYVLQLATTTGVFTRKIIRQ